MVQLGKTLMILGAAIALAGLLLMVSGRPGPIGEWLRRIPLGRLPGDIFVNKPGFSFYFPLGACLLASVVLSLILALFRK